LAVAGTAGAQDAENAPYRFELTPYAAYRFGGEFESETGTGDFQLDESDAEGLIFNAQALGAVDAQWEVLFVRQQTELETQPSFAGPPSLDIDVDYWHFGGTYLFDGGGVRPFIAMTVGVSHFEPRLPGFDDENYFSASFGAGVQLRAAKRVGVRLEGRVYASLVDSDGQLFCRRGGQASVCALNVDGTTLVQWETRAGLVFRF
jgi:hypothetical protein